MGKGRDAARSDTRTAKPASETTTLLPGEKRRRSRGTLHRNKPLENRKINFQESSQQANQARKTPPGIAQVNDNTRQAAEADPTPETGAKRQQGEKKKGQAPLLRRLEYHKTGPARSEDSKKWNIHRYRAERTTKGRHKATPRQSRTARKSPTVAIPSIEIRSKI